MLDLPKPRVKTLNIIYGRLGCLCDISNPSTTYLLNFAYFITKILFTWYNGILLLTEEGSLALPGK